MYFGCVVLFAFCVVCTFVTGFASLDGQHVYITVTDAHVQKRHVEREHPDVLPLTIQQTTQDGGHTIKRLILSKNKRIPEQGFNVRFDTAAYNDQARRDMSHIAHYRDTNGAIVAVTRHEDGTHSYEATFNVDNKRYHMSRAEPHNQTKRKPGFWSERHVLKEVESGVQQSTDRDAEYVDDMVSQAKREDENKDRESRSVERYYVTISFFIEYSEYKYALDQEGSHYRAVNYLNYKFSYLYNGMMTLFDSITSADGFTIDITVTDLYINDDPNQSPVSGSGMYMNPNVDAKTQQVNDRDLLKGWEAWAKANGFPVATFGDNSVPDHRILYTRYDLLFNGGGNSQGRASIGGLCNYHVSYTLVEDQGFAGYKNIVHELGHNMGAYHDGTKTSSTCSSSNGYIMAATTSIPVLDNAWSFSSCSKEIFRQKFQNFWCAKEPQGVNEWSGYERYPELPGYKYSHDEQCKLMKGDAYTGVGCEQYINLYICQRGLPCRSSTIGCRTNGGARPADGSSCGGSMTCMSGECV